MIVWHKDQAKRYGQGEPQRFHVLCESALSGVLQRLADMRAKLEAVREATKLHCCHVTGTHDPTHFEECRYVCQLQKSKAYEEVRKALGMSESDPAEAVPSSDCYWCNQKKKYQ